MKQKLKILYLVLMCLWIFLIPTNLFLKFGESQAYVHGLLSDYLLAKVYLTDIIGIGLIVVSSGWSILTKGVSSLRPNWTSSKSWLGLLVLFLLVQWIKIPYPLNLYIIIRLIFLGLLAFHIWQRRIWLSSSSIIITLSLTIYFQTSLALYQFISQHSLFGYWFLGEPNLSRGFALSQGVFNGVEKTLPYGTTAHPNVLAGSLLILTICSFWIGLHHQLINKCKFWLALQTGCLLLVIFMTQSVAVLGSGLLTIVGYVVWKYQPQFKLKQLAISIIVLMSLLTPLVLQRLSYIFPEQTSLQRREYLNQAGWNMWQSHPWFGVGLHQSTRYIEEYSPSLDIVRFVQPIHHLGLLWLAETGVLGMLLLATFLYLTRKTNLWLLMILLLPILVTDHYFLSLNTGQLILLLGLTCFHLFKTVDSLQQPKI